jgi:hypothetical protein
MGVPVLLSFSTRWKILRRALSMWIGDTLETRATVVMATRRNNRNRAMMIIYDPPEKFPYQKSPSCCTYSRFEDQFLDRIPC